METQPSKKGTQFPYFRSMSLVAKRLDGYHLRSLDMALGMKVCLLAHYCVRCGPSSPPQKRHNPSFFGPCLQWPNGWMDQGASATILELVLGPGYIVLDWPQLSVKGAQPHFSAPLPGRKVGLGRGHFVLDGDAAPPPKEHPQFWAYMVCCGQTAGWIKICHLVTREVGLGPDEMGNGDPAAPLKGEGAQPPIFGPYLLWSNGLMDQDATWFGCRPRPRPPCVR